MEKVKVFWTENASDNLQAIYEYIANDSIFYADRFIENLVNNNTHQLSISPSSGRYVPEFENTIIHFLRELIYGNYRIIYRFHKDLNQVNVIAVINAKMDLPNHISSWVL
jgi:plasmid stabilization system protein ParE